jgi:hypothetical protein
LGSTPTARAGPSSGLAASVTFERLCYSVFAALGTTTVPSP